LIALLMMLCISGAAFAQTTLPVFCGDLSAADCTILTNSQTATKSLDSASFNLTVNTTMTNVPQMQEPVTIGVTGSGSYSGVAALHMGGMTNMTMMQTDPGAFFSSLLANFDGDLTLTVNLPPEVVAQAGAGTPNSVTLQLRLVDGFGYINFDTLKPLMSEMGSGMNFSGWGGLDLASLLKAALQQMPDMFSSMSGMSNGMDMTALMQQFSDPAFMGKFVTIKRTDAGTGDTATFETTINLAALMAQPEFQDMMRQQMTAQGQTMAQKDMDQMMSMMTMMYQNMTFTATQEIGVSDGFVHSIHAVINFDTNAMMTAMTSMEPTAEATSATPVPPAPVINIDFTITYNDFNSVAPITAPPNAAILPWQSLLGMDMTTPEATAEMMTPTMTATTGSPATTEPTMEMTAEPTSETTVEAPATSEVTTEPTVAVPTLEPTVEVTAGS